MDKIKPIYLNDKIVCAFCNQEVQRTGSFQKYCSSCKKNKEYWIYRIKYKPRETKRQQIFRKKHPEKIKEWAQRYYWEHRHNNSEYRLKVRNWAKQARLKLRKLVIEKYGGKCNCCGENKQEFLAIHHKNGGGTKHRQELRKKYSNIMRYAIKNNFPGHLQVLCHNCNSALGFYGYCPHKN